MGQMKRLLERTVLHGHSKRLGKLSALYKSLVLVTVQSVVL